MTVPTGARIRTLPPPISFFFSIFENRADGKRCMDSRWSTRITEPSCGEACGCTLLERMPCKGQPTPATHLGLDSKKKKSNFEKKSNFFPISNFFSLENPVPWILCRGNPNQKRRGKLSSDRGGRVRFFSKRATPRAAGRVLFVRRCLNFFWQNLERRRLYVSPCNYEKLGNRTQK